MVGERPNFASRGGFRGRGDLGPRWRGGPSRFGGRFSGGFEGRGRRDAWADDAPQEPDIDPALLERRRASASALLKRQVSQLQVTKSNRAIALTSTKCDFPDNAVSEKRCKRIGK